MIMTIMYAMKQLKRKWNFVERNMMKPGNGTLTRKNKRENKKNKKRKRRRKKKRGRHRMNHFRLFLKDPYASMKKFGKITSKKGKML